MTKMLRLSLATAVAIATLAPAAYASSVSITTNRVQVQVGENGGVQIRTAAGQPIGVSSTNTQSQVSGSTTSVTPLPFANSCYGRTQSSQTHTARQTPGGTVVYAENYTSTRVCQ
jgi:hypothetical protein